MEKNTLIAIVLSIAVLFGYEAMFVAPKRAQMLKEAKVVAIKKDMAKATPLTTAAASSVLENITKTTNADEVLTKSGIKTTALVVDFSNVGGSLHSIKLNTSKDFPVKNLLTIKNYDTSTFRLIKNSDNIVTYGFNDGAWQITKTFEKVDDHLIKARITIKNVSLMSRLNDFAFATTNIDFSSLDISDQHEVMLDEYSVSVDQKITRKGSVAKFEPKENKVYLGKVGWTGFRNHFSTIVVKPEFETKGLEVKVLAQNHMNILVQPQEGNTAPGQTVTYDFSIYAGPQDISLIKKYGNDLYQIVAFSNYAILDWISKAIYFTIPFIHGIVRSWGVSIILISLIIYGLTYPLTIKSMASMRKMQMMQPKIAALKEKYKGDPQKLNTEMVEIYRREKINPLGGCLPFILQMPFFLAIYQVLWRSQYFQGQGFLWMKDLTQSDKLFILPFTIPFLGNEFNILPLLMGGVMFMQQKLSAKNMVATDETQIMQQKMMTIFFPFFITFIFYKFASSLSLYFTMFYLLSTLTQWKMSKAPIK